MTKLKIKVFYTIKDKQTINNMYMYKRVYVCSLCLHCVYLTCSTFKSRSPSTVDKTCRPSFRSFRVYVTCTCGIKFDVNDESNKLTDNLQTLNKSWLILSTCQNLMFISPAHPIGLTSVNEPTSFVFTQLQSASLVYVNDNMQCTHSDLHVNCRHVTCPKHDLVNARACMYTYYYCLVNRYLMHDKRKTA